MLKLKTLQKNYRNLIIRKPWLMLLISVLFTVICGMRLKGLSQNPDNRIFFSKNDPNLVALEILEKTYTKNDNIFIMVAPKNGNVFTPTNLEIIRDLTKKLWQTPASSRVDSITNFQWTRANGDDIIISDLVPDGKITDEISKNAKD